MAEGRSNNGITEALRVSPSAVEKYVSNIFAKLDLAPTDTDHRRVLAVLGSSAPSQEAGSAKAPGSARAAGPSPATGVAAAGARHRRSRPESSSRSRSAVVPGVGREPPMAGGSVPPRRPRQLGVEPGSVAAPSRWFAAPHRGNVGALVQGDEQRPPPHRPIPAPHPRGPNAASTAPTTSSVTTSPTPPGSVPTPRPPPRGGSPSVAPATGRVGPAGGSGWVAAGGGRLEAAAVSTAGAYSQAAAAAGQEQLGRIRAAANEDGEGGGRWWAGRGVLGHGVGAGGDQGGGAGGDPGEGGGRRSRGPWPGRCRRWPGTGAGRRAARTGPRRGSRCRRPRWPGGRGRVRGPGRRRCRAGRRW